MIRALRRRLADDSGLSMTELLVAMVVTTLILAAAAGLFIQTSRLTTTANQTQTSTRVTSTAINEISSVLQVTASVSVLNADSAVAVVSATPTSLTLYANVDTIASAPAPSRVTFTLDATGKLTETRYTGTASGTAWTFPSSPSSTVILATGLRQTAPSGEPLFQYFDHTTDPSNPTAAYTPMTLTSGAVANPAAVASIRVTVSAVTAGNGVAAGTPVVDQNLVVLRNISLGN